MRATGGGSNGRRWSWPLLFVVSLALAAPAWAQESEPSSAKAKAPSTDKLKAAKEKNQQGKELFNLGQFKEAAAAYGEAYAAVPLPAFLYNLGQCHARMEAVPDLERAVFYFETYLSKQPAAPNQAEVKEEIARLEGKIATLRDHNKPVLMSVAGAQARPEGDAPVYKKWWFWTIIGVAVAGAAAGVTVALLPGENAPVGGSLWPGVISFD